MSRILFFQDDIYIRKSGITSVRYPKRSPEQSNSEIPLLCEIRLLHFIKALPFILKQIVDGYIKAVMQISELSYSPESCLMHPPLKRIERHAARGKKPVLTPLDRLVAAGGFYFKY
jgi:hypothetical protein